MRPDDLRKGEPCYLVPMEPHPEPPAPILYSYIGPQRIADRVPLTPSGTPIRSPSDVKHWVRESEQQLDGDGCVIATFVVDAVGTLLVSDRHSEHVACAGRQSVRSAGEIAFRVAIRGVEVVAVSNQSTGYCPDPESWPLVATALTVAGLEPPQRFEPECVFRLCPKCGGKNLVKQGVFECGMCEAELPLTSNCHLRTFKPPA